jgi:hypothetical protein
MKMLLKDLRDCFKVGWEFRHRTDSSLSAWRRNRKVATLEFLISYALCAVRIMACYVIGHKLEDNSYCGPNSACERLECSRCGWSWTHNYY